MSDHVETVYGDQIVAREVDGLGSYIAVVDPIPWRMCRADLPHLPTQVVVVETLERARLDEHVAGLAGCDAVVGIGGGMVVDAAKYLANSAGALPLLVPSITSSDAPFSDSISVRTGGAPTGMVVPGQCKRVVVDFDLILRADPRLNRAGFADLLSHSIALMDCRRAVDAGRAAINKSAYQTVSDVMAESQSVAPAVGAGSRDGVEFVMRSFERLTRLSRSVPDAPPASGSEHLVAWNVEAVTSRHFIHGEVVALGIVIAAIVHGADASLRHALDQAKVRYTLTELGVSWPELEQALRTVDDYNQQARQLESVFTDLDWTDDLLATVRAVVDQ